MPVVTFFLIESCYNNVCCDKTGKIVKHCYLYISYCMGEKRNAYGVLMWKPGGERLLGKL
jgi:hypothetical protein